jgi:Zinc finger, C2H2 type
VRTFLSRYRKKTSCNTYFLSPRQPPSDLSCRTSFSWPSSGQLPHRQSESRGMSACDGDGVGVATGPAMVEAVRKGNATCCLACGFPVDGERSLLGVVNRFQEMLAHAGYAVGELVMRNEPGGRTTLRLDLTGDSHRVEELNKRPGNPTEPPDCAVAAAAGRRSSCRMCASACSISNCDADCDHDAAETSPAHIEHQSNQPSESRRPGSSFPAEHGQVWPVPARRRRSAPQLAISQPSASRVSPRTFPSDPHVRQNSDAPITEQPVQPHSTAQAAGHHHHHHHRHHHRQRGNRGSNLLAISHDGNDTSARDEPFRGGQSCPNALEEARELHLGADEDVYVDKAVQQNTPRNADRPRPERNSQTARKRLKVGGNDAKDAPTCGETSQRVPRAGSPWKLGEEHATEALQPVDAVPTATAPATSASGAPAFPQVHETSSGGDGEAQTSPAEPKAGTRRPAFDMPTCDACEEVFQSDLDVQRHHFSVHPAPPTKNGNGRVECPVPECHQDFVREHVMRRHIQSVHLQIREYQCQSCDKDFADQSTLNQHVTAVHLKRKPWTCSVCGANFTQSSSLGKHRRRFHQDNVLSGTSGVEDTGKATGNCSRDSNHDADENIEELPGESALR